MNDVLRVIQKRRSVRRYCPEQLPDRELALILEAGRAAPSARNNQKNHFLVIRNAETLSRLRALVTREFKAMEITEGMPASLVSPITQARKGSYDFFYSAPTLIVAANEKGYLNAIADCACALENMMLAAASLDVGSCWINQLHWLDSNAAVRVFLYELGLGETETVCGGLALGYAEGELPGPIRIFGNKITFVR